MRLRRPRLHQRAIDPPGAARGTVLLVRGGGWSGSDPGRVDDLLGRYGPALAAWGRRAVAIDLPPERAGLETLLAALDREGATALWGESSGGHLALVAAARRPAVRAVIADSAPLDFGAAAAAGRDAGQGEWRRWGERGLELFGDELDAWTPVALAPSIAAAVSLVRTQDDPVIPPAQADLYRAANPAARLLSLPPGPRRGVHGSMPADGLERTIAFALEGLAGAEAGA